jgi:hypothetical protein
LCFVVDELVQAITPLVKMGRGPRKSENKSLAGQSTRFIDV